MNEVIIMSKRNRGAKALLYVPELGELVTSGALDDDSWYRISARAATGSALPDLDDKSIFKTPILPGDAITLVAGDEVWPITNMDEGDEVCKADIEISGEVPVIEVTDSCDYPYTANIPDGFTGLSGSINTMMRFDDETDELIDVAQEFLNRFYDIVEDDGAGTYALTAKNDDNLLMFVLLNSDTLNAVDMVENWLIIPIILNSISQNIALKDVLKADYGWTKGEGPAEFYLRTVSSS
jgi:hypothetical protein